jgi:hypothetical protein
MQRRSQSQEMPVRKIRDELLLVFHWKKKDRPQGLMFRGMFALEGKPSGLLLEAVEHSACATLNRNTAIAATEFQSLLSTRCFGPT